jgi:hypothetical protein
MKSQAAMQLPLTSSSDRLSSLRELAAAGLEPLTHRGKAAKVTLALAPYCTGAGSMLHWRWLHVALALAPCCTGAASQFVSYHPVRAYAPACALLAMTSPHIFFVWTGAKAR